MPIIEGKYYTDAEIAEIKSKLDSDAFDSFLISGVIGAVTGSSVLGFLVGGNLAGALLGDFAEGTNDSLF